MIAKKKQLEKHSGNKLKTNEEYFNCKKKNYYIKDCNALSSNKTKPNTLVKEAKHNYPKKNQAKTVTTKSITDNKNLNRKPYFAGQVFMTRIADDKKPEVWYLNYYVSKPIYNN